MDYYQKNKLYIIISFFVCVILAIIATLFFPQYIIYLQLGIAVGFFLPYILGVIGLFMLGWGTYLVLRSGRDLTGRDAYFIILFFFLIIVIIYTFVKLILKL
jgi:hypothetical protein